MAALPGQPASSSLPVEHLSQEGLVLLGVSPTMTLLSSICVIIRFLSRRRASSIQIDDWVCLVSLLSAYGAMIGSIVFVTRGHAGYHVQEYMPPVLKIYMNANLACMMTYYLSIALTKTSILLFYQRLFALHRNLLRAIWVLHVLVLAFLVSALCSTIFTFIAMESVWKPWVPPQSSRVDTDALGYSLGAINSGLDFALLLLPQRAVWKLQMGRRQKQLVSGAFFLGLIVCCVTIVRLITIALVTKPNMEDLTNTSIFPVMLSLIEMNVSIICACLPMFPSLFRHWRSSNSDTENTNSRTFLRQHRLRDHVEPGAIADSREELNTQAGPAYRSTSYYQIEMKPPRVQVGALADYEVSG